MGRDHLVAAHAVTLVSILVIVNIAALVNRQTPLTRTEVRHSLLSFLHAENLTPPHATATALIQQSLHCNCHPISGRLRQGIRPSYTTTSLLLHLLLLSGDIETQPGPRPPKFPCLVCSKAVKQRDPAVCCDTCEKWTHTKCMGMNTAVYTGLMTESVSWHCIQCGMPNFSSAYFNTSIPTSENAYSTLGSSLASHPENPGTPLASSTPHKRPGPNQPKRQAKIPKSRLKLLNVNCQSINNKRAEFQHLVDENNPDIVVATETWLRPDIKDGEIGALNDFSNDYNIYRKDRTTAGGGGVMIAVKKTLISNVADGRDTDCEILWVQIRLKDDKLLNVGGFYHPHTQSEESYHQFECSLNRLASTNTIVWLAGDFNLPNINWEDNTVQNNATHIQIQERFLNSFADAGLEQLVSTPTRGTNILDLFLANNPGHVQECKVTDGISDHDAVVVEADMDPQRPKKPRRKIPFYKKADWKSFAEHIETHYKTMKDTEQETDVNSMWNNLKKAINDGIDKFIPHRQARSSNHKPWVTRELKTIINQRRRLYQKLRKKGINHRTNQKLKALKADIQKKMRQGYWNYLSNILTPETDSGRESQSY